ncbi:MAG: hypothetical protein IT324_05800 [Anaerolineae bacterium]|nr:hypothetical protein [Anaerolineae bacterium]
MALQKTFGEAELDANRNGHLTEGQIKALRNRRFRKALQVCLSIGALIGIIAISITGNSNSPLSFVLVVLWVGIFLIIGAIWVLPKWNVYAVLDTDPSGVTSATGIINLDIEDHRSITNGTVVKYFLRVSGYSFQISKEILLTLKNGEQYQVYFTPRSKMFLSAEPINAFTTLADEKPKHDQVVRLGDDGELIYEKAKRQ